MCSSVCPLLQNAMGLKTAWMEVMKWTVPWRHLLPLLRLPASKQSSCVIPKAVSHPSWNVTACLTATLKKMKLAAVSYFHCYSYGDANLLSLNSDVKHSNMMKYSVKFTIPSSRKILFVSLILCYLERQSTFANNFTYAFLLLGYQFQKMLQIICIVFLLIIGSTSTFIHRMASCICIASSLTTTWQIDRFLQLCTSVTLKAVMTFQGFWNQVCSCSSRNLYSNQGKGLTSKTQGQQALNCNCNEIP